MPPKKLTSQRAIEDALDSADIGTRVLVLFKCITDVEWLIDDQGTDIISDMEGNALKPATLAAIVSGVAREYTLEAKDEATLLTHKPSDESLWVIPAVISTGAPSAEFVLKPDGTGLAAVNPDDATWRGSRRRGLKEGATPRASREERQEEALALLRSGPLVMWPHKHANPVGRVALRDLVRQGLITMTIEDRLDLAAFGRNEYTMRRCKVYRLKPTSDVDGT